MKYTFSLLFLFLMGICNAQTERFKQILSDTNVDASLGNYQNELRARNSSAVFKTIDESNAIVVNGRFYSGKEMNEKLAGFSVLYVSYIEITEDKKKISLYTDDIRIKKLVFIITKPKVNK